MNEVSWQNGPRMMANGPHEMAGRQNNNNVPGSRSQDDATVGYFFQRPQTDTELNTYTNKRWAIGDDSIIEHVSDNLASSYSHTISMTMKLRNLIRLSINKVKPFTTWP